MKNSSDLVRLCCLIDVDINYDENKFRSRKTVPLFPVCFAGIEPVTAATVLHTVHSLVCYRRCVTENIISVADPHSKYFSNFTNAVCCTV